mmetsp:Transcript_19476/g.46075  ORF Transcript_19476/g.46075 Transcript_19476/m.46075 type:complete len:382 (-) Transcript_19476:319-1464(-)
MRPLLPGSGLALLAHNDRLLLIVIVVAKVELLLLARLDGGRLLAALPRRAPRLAAGPLVLLRPGAVPVVHRLSILVHRPALHPRHVDGVVPVVVVLLEVAAVHPDAAPTRPASTTLAALLLGQILVGLDLAGLLQFRIFCGGHLLNPGLLHVALPDGQREVLVGRGLQARWAGDQARRDGSLTFQDGPTGDVGEGLAGKFGLGRLDGLGEVDVSVEAGVGVGTGLGGLDALDSPGSGSLRLRLGPGGGTGTGRGRLRGADLVHLEHVRPDVEGVRPVGPLDEAGVGFADQAAAVLVVAIERTVGTADLLVPPPDHGVGVSSVVLSLLLRIVRFGIVRLGLDPDQVGQLGHVEAHLVGRGALVYVGRAGNLEDLEAARLLLL